MSDELKYTLLGVTFFPILVFVWIVLLIACYQFFRELFKNSKDTSDPFIDELDAAIERCKTIKKAYVMDELTKIQEQLTRETEEYLEDIKKAK
jgi:hypothetical protein